MGSQLPVVANRPNSTSPATERRQSPRIATARMVRIAHDGCTTLARCRDISDTGVKICVLEPIEPGERVEVAFSSRVSLRGRVIWVEGPECGIEFEREIDSIALLSSTALEARAETDASRVRGTQEAGAQSPTNRFRPGLNVVLMLKSGREERALLNWTISNFAGLLRDPGDEQRVIIDG